MKTPLETLFPSCTPNGTSLRLRAQEILTAIERRGEWTSQLHHPLYRQAANGLLRGGHIEIGTPDPRRQGVRFVGVA